MYGKLTADNQDATTAFTEADDTTADVYSLTTGDGYLTSDTGSPGYFAQQNAGEDTDPIYFWDLDDIIRNAASFQRITCAIASAGDGTCPLYCTSPFNGGVTQSIDVVNAWALGQSSDGTEFTPLVVDAGGS